MDASVKKTLFSAHHDVVLRLQEAETGLMQRLGETQANLKLALGKLQAVCGHGRVIEMQDYRRRRRGTDLITLRVCRICGGKETDAHGGFCVLTAFHEHPNHSHWTIEEYFRIIDPSEDEGRIEGSLPRVADRLTALDLQQLESELEHFLRDLRESKKPFFEKLRWHCPHARVVQISNVFVEEYCDAEPLPAVRLCRHCGLVEYHFRGNLPPSFHMLAEERLGHPIEGVIEGNGKGLDDFRLLSTLSEADRS